MALPDVVTREQWLAARTELLAAEKEATRSRDALNTRRRQLPMVRIDKDYKFDAEQGTVPLAALFGDSRQLIIQHVMFETPFRSCWSHRILAMSRIGQLEMPR